MVKDFKISLVDELAKSLKKAKSFGIADLGRVTSSQINNIRKVLRKDATLKMVKRTLLKKALERSGIKDMEDYIAQTSIVLTSNLDAFTLFRELKNTRQLAVAKPGMISPIDIIVKQGGTGLPPGPAIADLQNAGIPAKIEKGQIVVLKDHIVTKAGEEITAPVAMALNKLDLRPFDMGLEITAILEDGLIFRKDVLDVNIDEYQSNFALAGSEAFSLAYAINYPIKEVIDKRMSELANEAKALALAIGWVNNDTVAELMSKANTEAISLKNKIGGK